MPSIPCSPRRRRVLWLIKGLGPGGAERLLEALATACDHEAFEVEVAYLLRWKSHLVAGLEASGLRVTCLDCRSELDLRWAARLRRLLRERHFDVLHVHSPYVASVARIVACTLPRSARPRIVSTEHNEWTRFSWPTRLANALTGALDAARVAVSEDVRRSMWSPLRDRTETLVHGIRIERIRELRAERDAVRTALGVAGDTVLVGTIANYTRQKDYPNLLEATKLLVERGPSVRILAIGQGPLEREILALRHELDLDGSVIMPGYRADAVRLLAGCDVFVLASAWEGLPVAVMEALGLGLPIVATAVGGVPSAITDGAEARLVPPRRPDLLADAISEVAGDPELRAAMAAAAEQRADDFDVGRAARRLEDLYRDVAP